MDADFFLDFLLCSAVVFVCSCAGTALIMLHWVLNLYCAERAYVKLIFSPPHVWKNSPVKPPRPGVFFWGRFLIKNPVYLLDVELSEFSFSSFVSLANLVFQEICVNIKVVKFVGLNLFIISSYYILTLTLTFKLFLLLPQILVWFNIFLEWGQFWQTILS